MSVLEELVETGVGALALSFGVVAGVAVYSTGSVAAVVDVTARFVDAVALTVLPPTSLAAWPNAVAGLAGTGAAVSLEDSVSYRVAGFVATYLFLAVLLHYLFTPA